MTRPAVRPGARVRSDDIRGTVTRVEYADLPGQHRNELIFVNWCVPAFEEPVRIIDAIAGSCTR